MLLAMMALAPALTAAEPQPQAPAKQSRGHADTLWQHALTHAGDAKRGRQLYETHPGARCTACHRLAALAGEAMTRRAA